jgi:hypothetical protein
MLFSQLDRIYRIKFENHCEQIGNTEEGSSLRYCTVTGETKENHEEPQSV